MAFSVRMDRPDYFKHYGVKGMKWGVRRTPEQLGHKPKKPKWNKKQVRFRLTKEKGFDIPVPQVKNKKLQSAINYGARCMEPFLSPGGLLVGAIIAPIPGIDAPVVLAGMAAYDRIKEQGFTATVVEAKGFTKKTANKVLTSVKNVFKKKQN